MRAAPGREEEGSSWDEERTTIRLGKVGKKFVQKIRLSVRAFELM